MLFLNFKFLRSAQTGSFLEAWFELECVPLSHNILVFQKSSILFLITFLFCSETMKWISGEKTRFFLSFLSFCENERNKLIDILLRNQNRKALLKIINSILALFIVLLKNINLIQYFNSLSRWCVKKTRFSTTLPRVHW